MSWTVPDFPLRDGENEYDLKLQFARLWAEAPHSKRIGYHLFPGRDDQQRALIAQSWYNDLTVIDEYERLAKHDPGSVLPSKDQVALEVLDAARKALTTDDKVKAYKLYAELNDMISKPGVSINNQIDNRTQQVVFRVPAEQSIEDFERDFLAQQTRLYSDARKRVN